MPRQQIEKSQQQQQKQMKNNFANSEGAKTTVPKGTRAIAATNSISKWNIGKEIDQTKPKQNQGFKEIVNEDKQNKANDKPEEIPIQITIEYEQDSPVKEILEELEQDKEPSAILEQLIKPKSQFDPIYQPKPVEVV